MLSFKYISACFLETTREVKSRLSGFISAAPFVLPMTMGSVPTTMVRVIANDDCTGVHVMVISLTSDKLKVPSIFVSEVSG